MATVQSYTKTGVDNKMASRSNVTLTYSGTGTPELSAFPDAKTGDIIERSSDRAQWRVLGNTLASLGHIVTKVNGQTGEVNITAAGLNASPTGHKHTIADITDLTVSTGATADHVVKRIASGNITVPTTPNANTSAASKSYVDSQVSAKANTSHTHTIADITDLTVSTAATANHVVKRITSGNITVPTTPNASTSAASKSYVDTEVGKKANTSHAHSISDVSGLQEALNSAGSSVHTHVSADVTDAVYGDVATSPERLVKTDVNGYLRAPAAPTAATHATSKTYVDTEVGKKANTSHTHTIADITDLTVSTGATADHVVKRIASGNITVPTTPNASTSAASKSYVDTEVGKKANTSHTHTKSNITDLETVSTGATGNHIVKRNTDGNITVPATPAATTSATSKSYVDTEVGKKANASHTHTSDDVEGTVYIGEGDLFQVVKTGNDGHLHCRSNPTSGNHLARKSYVDTEVGKKANTSHTHTSTDITNKTHFGGTGNSGRVVGWGSDGHLYQPNDPTNDNHLSRKGYVDKEVAKKADSSHKHLSADITDKYSGVWGSAEDNRVVATSGGGYIETSKTPTHANHLTRKGYVDQEVAKKANTSHTHTSANITDARTWTGRSTDSNSIVKTDDNGWFYVGSSPTHGSHPANKSYVDNSIPWVGTLTEYNVITNKDPNRLYIIRGA